MHAKGIAWSLVHSRGSITGSHYSSQAFGEASGEIDTNLAAALQELTVVLTPVFAIHMAHTTAGSPWILKLS